MTEAFSVEAKDGQVRVFASGLLHLCFRQSELMAVQAWVTGEDRKLYVVEFTGRSGATVRAEYDKKDKWEAVLKLLAGKNLFLESL